MNQSSADFEAVVLNEIKSAWYHNLRQFKWAGSGLLVPNFIITDAKVDHIGQWCPDTRAMSFSRDVITNRPWNEVLELLKHEMAHQYVSEVLHVTDEAPHGPAFKTVCKTNNIDAAPKGLPGAPLLTTTNHIVEKIRHLLELANNSGASEEEAKTAATLAHNMMLKYNIELQEKNEERGYTVSFVGGTTGRIQAYMNALANLLSEYYFVEIIWVSTHDPRSKKSGHELEISGTNENVEVAEYVYDFVSKAALKAWQAKFNSPEYKTDMAKALSVAEYYYRQGRPQTKTGYAISARTNFMAGFIAGYKSQLQQASVNEKETGLVLAQDPALEAFYKTRHPHIRNMSGGSGYFNSSMRGQGYDKGKALKLPPGVKASKQYTPLLGK